MPSLSLAHTGAPVAATACQGTAWTPVELSSVQSVCPVCQRTIWKPVSCLSVQSDYQSVREPSEACVQSVCPICPSSCQGTVWKPMSSLSLQSVCPVCQCVRELSEACVQFVCPVCPSNLSGNRLEAHLHCYFAVFHLIVLCVTDFYETFPSPFRPSRHT